MDISGLLLAYALSQGAHTAGHFAEANKQDVPITLNPESLTESWRTNDRVKDSNINGAGFIYQDSVRDIAPPIIQNEMSLANAIIKGAYLSGLPNKLSGDLQKGGDIGGLEKASGNRHVKELVGASALWDLLKATGVNKNKNIDYDFAVVDGAPGGKITYRW